jgi:hypothetical protein
VTAAYRIYEPICVFGISIAVSNESESTDSGAIENRSAEMRRECTPKKNEIFSRVRTTFAECHAVVSLVILAVI